LTALELFHAALGAAAAALEAASTLTILSGAGLAILALARRRGIRSSPLRRLPRFALAADRSALLERLTTYQEIEELARLLGGLSSDMPGWRPPLASRTPSQSAVIRSAIWW
jgi:hypothetical protein